jgi:hypothetical protein
VKLAIIGHQRLAGAAFVDSGRVWLVFAPVVLLIVFLYLLLVIFPNTDKRVRRVWAICIPLALILIMLDIHFPLDPHTFRGFDGLVETFALMLFIAPIVVTPTFQAAISQRRGGPIPLLLAAIAPSVLSFTVPRYFPGFWHTQVGILVLIGWFVIAFALVRWQKGPRAR